ncbi:MAG: beta-glucosidase [Micavibrio aeruginosavorus]|uniref:Beta-glucosidase n=1 Tax=Micavibrio aeruginosavorus TaxID=349221 RepID=A0A2W5N9H9_9BACT|nr:MAG: beta-glucosidase [Micavibrio aeruginosavorus]
MTNNTSPSFIWGTATAAFQIEGAWNADGKGPSIWDTFSHTPGNVKNNDNGDVACDHYNRVDEDVALIKNLGVDAYRMSISWTRLLPEGTGQLNQKGADFYNRLFDKLLEKNITPWATLYHWDLPQALQDKGGWTNRDITGWFEEYTDHVCRLYGDRVKNYIIINEPSIITYLGHYLGIFAPGIKSLDAMYASQHHINLVNGLVTQQMRGLLKDTNLGSSYTYFPMYPKDPSKPEDVRAAQIMDETWQRNFADPLFKGVYPANTLPHVEKYIKDGDMKTIVANQDYFGINHYNSNYVRADDSHPLGASNAEAPPGPRTDIGWNISPADLKVALIEIKEKYGNPVVCITENGMCENSEPDAKGVVNDDRRVGYLKDYTDAMFDARDNHGCNLQGYFVWSLMDNFEWAEGYGMRFGIVHMDYQTLKRTPKKSYDWYKSKIAESR